MTAMGGASGWGLSSKSGKCFQEARGSLSPHCPERQDLGMCAMFTNRGKDQLAKTSYTRSLPPENAPDGASYSEEAAGGSSPELRHQ
jgi:hypothetical protein